MTHPPAIPRALSRVPAWLLAAACLAPAACTAAAKAQQAQQPTLAKPIAAAMPAVAPTNAKIFPLAEIHRGQTGVAYTVFEGVTPEPMALEILGVLKDAIGPGQDMILARLKGEKPEFTGIVAGMSGSPVYIDGRLVGALSYRIGQFSKEPICGITPIEQMLEVRDGQPGSAMQVAHAATPLANQTTPTSSAGEIQPIDTALVFGGFSQDTVARFGDRFRALGMNPVAGLGGASAPGTRQPEPIVPGSAVSAVLVRGDLSISGTCTVTYVDPKQLLACGHPITQFGPVDIPMTKAEVVATLASQSSSFKIINTTETVGAFTQDRASAILGRFGATARMIPVSVEVVRAGSPAANLVRVSSPQIQASDTQKGLPLPDASTAAKSGGLHFEVLDNRDLTPSAILTSVYQTLSGTNESASELSYRMSGELTLKGFAPVRLEGIMAPSGSGGTGAEAAALYVNDRFSRLYSNALEQPDITGLHLRMEEVPERRAAVIESARIARTELHPGETVEVEATLHPWQAEARVVRLQVKLPETLAPGPMRLVVSDGALLDRLTAPAQTSQAAGASQRPVPLADAVAQINRMHPNDRIYVTLLDHTAQAALDAVSLPAVPLSMANMLEPMRAAQKVQLNGESAIEAASQPTDYAVSGMQVLTVEIR